MTVRPAAPAEAGGLIAEAERRQGAPPFGEALLTAMAAGRGFGAVGERAGAPAAYGYAAPNPDGRAWILEIAALSGEDYGWFLGAFLERLAAAGAAEAVLWVHAPALEPPAGLVRPERELLRMAVELPVEDDRPPPEGASIRGFRPDRDRETLLELNNRAFAGHPEQGGWTLRDLDERTALPWFDPEGVRTVWIDGRMAAFNWTKVHPAPPGGRPMGEIYAIGVDPRCRGRGLGRAAAAEGLRRLSDRRGADRAVLYVDSSNEAAVGLYRSLGFATEHVDRAYRWTGGR